jgi:hypothetical protein
MSRSSGRKAPLAARRPRQRTPSDWLTPGIRAATASTRPPGRDSTSAGQAIEVRLQERADLVHHGRIALLRRREPALVVAQEHQGAVVAERFTGEFQDVVHEDAPILRLQREVADAKQHLDADLAARQLLGEPGRQRCLAVPFLAVGSHALDELLDLLDRKRLRQVIVGPVAQPEDRRVHRRRAGDEHHRRAGLPRFHRAQEVQSGKTGHLDVGHDEVEVLAADELKRPLRRRCRGDRAAVGGEGGDQEAKERSVVVDGQHTECRRRGHQSLPVYFPAAIWLRNSIH